MKLRLQEIPYHPDSSDIFAPLASRPWSIFLDSAKPFGEQGRYDIICAHPKRTLVTKNSLTTITQGDSISTVRNDPFTLLESFLPRTQEPVDGLPFCGGAAGYFAYDLGRRIERIPQQAVDDLQLPDMAIGIYPWALIIDHELQKTTLAGDVSDSRTRLDWDELVALFSTVSKAAGACDFRTISKVTSNMSEAQYAQAFVRVKQYIEAGDCYQVNLAQRFQAQVSGDTWTGYCRLRKMNPSPFSAFLNLPEFQVLSASPERFLLVHGKYVETKPIKGTRPRSAEAQADAEQRRQLECSTKDQAENLMIVDLLRNDLSKACVLGSVKVPKLFAVESFPTVHHLVSTVTGQLGDYGSPVKLLRACFPGGSITGAPKIRAMEIIEELEPQRRNVYCGSIGYIGYNGNMDTNIAIRTMTHQKGMVYFHAGGGIVWDSELQAEYQETFDKAAALLRLLEPK